MLMAAIDPGIASCGWSVVHFAPRILLVEGGTITTEANTPVEERLWFIAGELMKLPVDAIAWERQSGAHHGHQREGTTDAKALEVLKVEGVIVAICRLKGMRMAPCTPQQAKKALAGYGFAGKTQVKDIVNALPKGPAWPKRFSKHCADSVAIAMGGRIQLGRKGL